MKMLRIDQCSDGMMWYRDQVGSIVPLVRDLNSEGTFLTREPSGFSNVVRKCDVTVIDTALQEQKLLVEG